jgi:hypothetical protein
MQRISQNWFVKWVLAPVAVLCALGWGFIPSREPVCTFRYKLSIEVMTPDGLKTGSSVVEVNYQRGRDFGGGSSEVMWANGEAVYIDLGKGKNLFITLTKRLSGRDNYDVRSSIIEKGGASSVFGIFLKAYEIPWALGKERELCSTISAKAKLEPKSLSPLDLPTLVTFENIDDVKSAQIIQPDELASFFGAGYGTIKSSVALTNDPVSNSLSGLLPWLGDKDLRQRAQKFERPNEKLDSYFFMDAYKLPGFMGGGL